MTKVVMPLSRALYILASIHTKDDSVTGFTVNIHPDFYSVGIFALAEYNRAWEAVRAHIHLQTDPQGDKK